MAYNKLKNSRSKLDLEDMVVPEFGFDLKEATVVEDSDLIYDKGE